MMNEDTHHELSNILNSFFETIEEIKGIYFDLERSIGVALKEFEKSQQKSIELLKEDSPELANIEYLDSTFLLYGYGDPNKKDSKVLHKSTQKEYKIRNSTGGINYKFLGNMCLVMIYQYWDDHYRKKIAKLLNVSDEKKITSDILGDIMI